VVGFANSTSSASGLYLLIDVGAMTLDVCAFRLVRQPSAVDKYALLVAQIRPLGVEALHWFCAHGFTLDGFCQQCTRCVREVIWDTVRRRDPNAECFRKNQDLPVFLAGGGAGNSLHRSLTEQLSGWLAETRGNAGIRLLALPQPNGIDLPKACRDFSRLAVAWGLSYPHTDREILAMSSIPDIRNAVVDIDDRYIGPEQV
jgi:hypothetical protein